MFSQKSTSHEFRLNLTCETEVLNRLSLNGKCFNSTNIMPVRGAGIDFLPECRVEVGWGGQ